MSYLENNPTREEKYGESVKVKIMRVAPFLGGVEIEYRIYDRAGVYVKLHITELESGKSVYEKIEYHGVDALKAEGFSVNIDYVAEVIIYNKNMEEVARSDSRLFRCGFFPGQVIDYIHPCDVTYMRSGEFIGSAHIVKTESGSYIASHDVFSHDGTIGHDTLCRFFVSKDYGKTWHYISEVEHCTWGVMFRRGEVLYIIGTSEIVNGGGEVVMYFSTDEAQTWSEPIILVKRTNDKCYRTSPTAYVEHKNRIWFYLSTYTGNDLAMGTLSVDLDKDLRDPESWIASEEIMYNSDWDGVAQKWLPVMMEEGNAVVSPDGELKIIARCNSHRYDTPCTMPEKIKALMFRADTNNPGAKLEFEKAVPFNGAMHKFFLRYDAATARYIGLVNRMTTDQVWQRNVLSLVSSKDLYKWQIERDLINLEDINWSENAWECAVQYPSFLIEGNEIVAVVRTAINGADNFHNSNAMTFHRFKDINDKYRF